MIDTRREALHIERCIIRYMGRPKLPPEDPFSDVVQQRFWSHVQKTRDGCWLWTGGSQSSGYGVFHVRHIYGDRKSSITTHVYSYLLHHGELPEGQEVRHSCDTRLCVRPEHLLPGTRKDNMQDAVARNRLRSHNKNKTHCPKGHLYDEDYQYLGRDGQTHTGRRCRTCRQETWRRWNRRRRA